MNPIIIVGLAALLLFSKKKDTPQNPSNTQDKADPNTLQGELIIAFQNIKDKYGIQNARIVEKIFRLETANFTSGQFLKTLSPGMWAFSDVFPFGWNSLKEYANANGLNKDGFFLVSMQENTGQQVTANFIGFPSIYDSVGFLGYFMNKHGNNAGRWNSTDKIKQEKYELLLLNINTPIVDNL